MGRGRERAVVVRGFRPRRKARVEQVTPEMGGDAHRYDGHRGPCDAESSDLREPDEQRRGCQKARRSEREVPVPRDQRGIATHLDHMPGREQARGGSQRGAHDRRDGSDPPEPRPAFGPAQGDQHRSDRGEGKGYWKWDQQVVEVRHGPRGAAILVPGAGIAAQAASGWNSAEGQP